MSKEYWIHDDASNSSIHLREVNPVRDTLRDTLYNEMLEYIKALVSFSNMNGEFQVLHADSKKARDFIKRAEELKNEKD